MASTTLPTRRLAGITVPDTPLIKSSIALAREHLDDMSYNHIMRSFLFGFAAAEKIPPMASRDTELHAVAAILHDLAWASRGPRMEEFISKDKRFEVDGAEGARNFVKSEVGDGWDKHRLQLLWDAIALHTTPSIGQFKEPEVAATGLGIVLDFLGPAGAPGMVPAVLVTQEEWDAVRKEFSRTGFNEGVTKIMCGLCRSKPQTTFDNFVGEFGDMVEGYPDNGHWFRDNILKANVE